MIYTIWDFKYKKLWPTGFFICFQSILTVELENSRLRVLCFLSDPQGSVSSEYKVQKKLFEHLEKSRQWSGWFTIPCQLRWDVVRQWARWSFRLKHAVTATVKWSWIRLFSQASNYLEILGNLCWFSRRTWFHCLILILLRFPMCFCCLNQNLLSVSQ